MRCHDTDTASLHWASFTLGLTNWVAAQDGGGYSSGHTGNRIAANTESGQLTTTGDHCTPRNPA